MKKFADTNTKEAIEEHLKAVHHQTAACWAADCTEHIIHYFERTYPQDDRPRKAIASARSAGQAVATAHMLDTQFTHPPTRSNQSPMPPTLRRSPLLMNERGSMNIY